MQQTSQETAISKEKTATIRMALVAIVSLLIDLELTFTLPLFLAVPSSISAIIGLISAITIYLIISLIFQHFILAKSNEEETQCLRKP